MEMNHKGWLLDKSAWERLGKASEKNLWLKRIEDGLIFISTVTRLELGYSARNGDTHQALFANPPLTAMKCVYMNNEIEERALELQQMLAYQGHHRAPSIPDLIIAATAEYKSLSILHIDKDFELIAQQTNQPQERLKV